MPPTAPRPVERQAEDALSGLVERATFRNEENGFCVLKVKVKGERDLVPVIGQAASISAGEWIGAKGEWINDRQHGRQFRARFLRTAPPTSLEGIERYLGSGMVRGVGPVYARKLVQAFGETVFETIEAEPDRLREVSGIGPVRARKIVESWADQKAVREIMTFLYAHGVGTARAVRIHKTYGADAIAIMKENPYRLARDIRGVGFKTADAIAMRLGIDKLAMIRLRAGISYALSEASDEGHCGLPGDDLIRLASSLLEAPANLIETAVAEEKTEGAVIEDTVGATRCLFLAPLYHAERAAADRMRKLADGPLPWPPIDPEKAIAWVAGKTGLDLAPSQKQAIALALQSKVLVITGGPGVGKTTIVNSILRILAAKNVAMLLCAPTGRAAKRMAETSGREASTIHRLLETDPATGRFKRDADNPLDCDLIVVDEASMIDVSLMNAITKAVLPRAAMIIVGDTDQLPSVGPGQILSDLIASNAVPVVRLTEIFRQGAESRIIAAAHRVNAGALPDLGRPESVTDFYFVRCDEADDAAKTIIDLVRTRIPKRFGLDPVRDIQILCPMNRGSAGARTLNIDLQAALNPAGPKKIEKFGWTFAPGDKVMQIENDHEREVYNGDLGRILDIDADQSEMTIDFDGRSVVYPFGELDVIVPAYATTIHKSQGSEYPAVVIPVFTQHYTMLQRNLIYTAITRGRKLVVLVGQKKALAMAVRNASARRRWSKFAEWLAG